MVWISVNKCSFIVNQADLSLCGTVHFRKTRMLWVTSGASKPVTCPWISPLSETQLVPSRSTDEIKGNVIGVTYFNTILPIFEGHILYR